MYHIYRVELPATIKLGYDSYSEFTCVAESDMEARMMHPGAGMTFEFVEGDYHNSWIKRDQIDELRVTEIGTANDEHQNTELLTTSFHAG